MTAEKQIIKFGIKRLEVQSISLEESASTLLQTHGAHDIGVKFTIAPDFRFSISDKSAGVFMDVTAFIEKGEEKETIGKIKTLTLFNIENFDLLLSNLEKGLFPLSIENAKLLVGVAYSSTRGLLIGKATGTILGIIPMPIIDPSVFIKT